MYYTTNRGVFDQWYCYCTMYTGKDTIKWYNFSKHLLWRRKYYGYWLKQLEALYDKSALMYITTLTYLLSNIHAVIKSMESVAIENCLWKYFPSMKVTLESVPTHGNVLIKSVPTHGNVLNLRKVSLRMESTHGKCHSVKGSFNFGKFLDSKFHSYCL